MKKIVLVALVGGCIAAYTLGQKAATASVVPTSGAATTLVASAFQVTSARLMGYEVHDWTTLQNRALSLPQLETIGAIVTSDIQLGARTPTVRTSNQAISVIYSGRKRLLVGSAQVTVELMSMRFPRVTPQTVLVVREFASTSSDSAFAATYAKVSDAVQAVGGIPHINATMIGLLPAPLSESVRSQVIQRAFTRAGGKALQGMQDAYTSSDAGYVPNALAPFLRAGGERLNLQVALHKRNYQKDTKVLVGSPMITIEY